MRPSWEIAPYFAFIDLHFVLSQASISLTIKQGHSNEGFFLDRLPEIKIPISWSWGHPVQMPVTRTVETCIAGRGNDWYKTATRRS